jgi:hypothetical protein
MVAPLGGRSARRRGLTRPRQVRTGSRVATRFVTAMVTMVLVLVLVPRPGWSDGTGTGRGEVREVAEGKSITAALQASRAGDVVVLRDGVHPAVELEDLSLDRVVLRGETRKGAVLQGLTLRRVDGLTVEAMTIVNEKDSDTSAVQVSDGSRDLLFRKLTIAPRRYSAIDIEARSRRIAVRDSVLSGAKVTGRRATDKTSRGVRINGAPYDEDDWPSDITIADNEIRDFGSDLVQIGGGRRITIRNNDLRNPQSNRDHNDGVQSYGSDRLRIEGNLFSAKGDNGPNQAIMLSHHPSIESLRVTRTSVVGNLVTSWPGTGINVAGTRGTVLTGNVVGRTGSQERPGSSIAVHGENESLEISSNIAERIYLTDDRDLTITDESETVTSRRALD